MGAMTLRQALEDATSEKKPRIGDAGLGARLAASTDAPVLFELWNRDDSERIAALHREDREAGAELLVTNSFRADAATLRALKLEEDSADLARRAARIGREVAGQDAFVIGSLGPGPGDDDAPQAEDHLAAAQGLLRGGADGLLVETVRHAARAEAVIEAADRAAGHGSLPLLLSFTPDASGKLGCGTSLEEVSERAGERVFALGLNCVPLREEALSALLERLSKFDKPLFLAPNPSPDESAEAFAATLHRLAQRHALAFVRGCCGSTSAHVSALRRLRPPARNPRRT